jgi:hypothetical protein
MGNIFSPFCDLISLSQSSCVSPPVELTDGRKVGRGGGRSRIIRPQEAWSSINHSLLSDCTYLRRYTHKTSGFKTSGFKTSGFNTSETSGLQNVRFTKHHVYKTAGLQNIRLQYVRFQNVLIRKYFKTSGFKNVQYYITNYEEIQSKRITKVFW